MKGVKSDLQRAAQLLRGAFLLDHSVSVGTLGTLFQRSGDAPVQRLKQMIADAYGVAWGFPSSSGTTSLNILALLAVCPPGSTVVVNRDCHVSIQAAMIHGDLRPVYYAPVIDPEFGLPLGPTRDAVAAALERAPDVRCVVLTYPNYFGIAGECAEIIEVARSRGIPVLVDAAHGAHLHFAPELPDAAEDLGADIVTQSTHKTMGALSQGSVALFRSEEYLEPFYRAARQLGFVSTSFSYPVLSSIELAVVQHANAGSDGWRHAARQADVFRERVRETAGLSAFGDETVPRAGMVALDRTRVALDVTGAGFTGFEFARGLAARDVYAEMATNRHVLFLFTPGTRVEDTNYLLAEVSRTARGARRRGRITTRMPIAPAPAELVLSPRAAHGAVKRVVATDDAVGAVAGETIAPYPPGIAPIMAGERITVDALEYLLEMRELGATLHGAGDAELRTITIVA